MERKDVHWRIFCSIRNLPREIIGLIRWNEKAFSICHFLLLFNAQHSIEDGEFSLDANFVSREFLGEIAEEMDSLDNFLFSSVDLWWKNTYLLRK